MWIARDGRVVIFVGWAEGGEFIFSGWSSRFYGHEDFTWLVGMLGIAVVRSGRTML